MNGELIKYSNGNCFKDYKLANFHQRKSNCNLYSIRTKLAQRSSMLLHNKYFRIEKEYILNLIDCLIYEIPSRILSLYMDTIINSKNENLIRYFNLYEIFQLIKNKLEYYKTYLLFFLNPTFCNLRINKLISTYANTRAEIFYKSKYEKRKEYHICDYSNIFTNSVIKEINDNDLIMNEESIILAYNDNCNSVDNSIHAILGRLDRKNLYVTTNQRNKNKFSKAIMNIPSSKIGYLKGVSFKNCLRNKDSGTIDTAKCISSRYLHLKDKPSTNSNISKNRSTSISNKNYISLENKVKNKKKINTFLGKNYEKSNRFAAIPSNNILKNKQNSNFKYINRYHKDNQSRLDPSRISSKYYNSELVNVKPIGIKTFITRNLKYSLNSLTKVYSNTPINLYEKEKFKTIIPDRDSKGKFNSSLKLNPCSSRNKSSQFNKIQFNTVDKISRNRGDNKNSIINKQNLCLTRNYRGQLNPNFATINKSTSYTKSRNYDKQNKMHTSCSMGCLKDKHNHNAHLNLKNKNFNAQAIQSHKTRNPILNGSNTARYSSKNTSLGKHHISSGLIHSSFNQLRGKSCIGKKITHLKKGNP